jgi:hypothetical protein
METEVTRTKPDGEVADQSGDHQKTDASPETRWVQNKAGQWVEVPNTKGDKQSMFEPMDVNKVTPGRNYELSVNGGEVANYQLAVVNKTTGAVQLIKQREGKGKSHRIHVNANKCMVLRFKSKSTIQKEQAEKQKKELEESLKKNSPIFTMPEEDMNVDETASAILKMIGGGIRNIWMVGPAGCGKSTIASIVAEKLGWDFHVLSCGIGTSSTEFIGYKYPEREATPFGSYYGKPSVIVLDEFTALDPSVAQIANAALANDQLYTTTGLIKRHRDTVIIATSNTFGSGGDMSYVANNQLDASTIDRFVGGIIEVGYSEKYESQFDSEIVLYVNKLRKAIHENGFRRIASTRMIIQGEKLKNVGLNWRKILISNWTIEEQQVLIQ